jgi:hypothetical protein
MFCLFRNYNYLSNAIVPKSFDVMLLNDIKLCEFNHGQDTYTDMSEISPHAVLVAALQGIAEAIDVRTVAGVCAANQLSYKESEAELFDRVYDQFFRSIGANGPNNGWRPFAGKAHWTRASGTQTIEARIQERNIEDSLYVLAQYGWDKSRKGFCAGQRVVRTGLGSTVFAENFRSQTIEQGQRASSVISKGIEPSSRPADDGFVTPCPQE